MTKTRKTEIDLRTQDRTIVVYAQKGGIKRPNRGFEICKADDTHTPDFFLPPGGVFDTKIRNR